MFTTLQTVLGTTTDSVQGDDNRRKKQRKVRLQESSAFNPYSVQHGVSLQTPSRPCCTLGPFLHGEAS